MRSGWRGSPLLHPARCPHPRRPPQQGWHGPLASDGPPCTPSAWTALFPPHPGPSCTPLPTHFSLGPCLHPAAPPSRCRDGRSSGSPSCIGLQSRDGQGPRSRQDQRGVRPIHLSGTLHHQMRRPQGPQASEETGLTQEQGCRKPDSGSAFRVNSGIIDGSRDGYGRSRDTGSEATASILVKGDGAPRAVGDYTPCELLEGVCGMTTCRGMQTQGLSGGLGRGAHGPEDGSHSRHTLE